MPNIFRQAAHAKSLRQYASSVTGSIKLIQYALQYGNTCLINESVSKLDRCAE